MKVLVIGGGGREHALVWKLAQSPERPELFCAPGSDGIAQIAQTANIRVDQIPHLVAFAREQKIDLTVVGPEQPLVAGLVDAFEKEGLAVVGPRQAAARIEGSKIFMKELLTRHGVRTAPYRIFESKAAALTYLRGRPFPQVLKVDGLAGGKGAFVLKSLPDAWAALGEVFDQKAFGDAGRRVFVEDFLPGEEASLIVLTDGERCVPLPTAQDHKALLDGDEGPNTGGMGAYVPAPVLTPHLQARAMDEIIRPVLRGMAEMGCPYRGFLYAGLMIRDGDPWVLEFNARPGDPETQPQMMGMRTDLLPLLAAVASGRLPGGGEAAGSDAAACVVLASKGYPGKPEKGKLIVGLDSIPAAPDQMVFHAGAKKTPDGWVTDGGRVLGVTARAATLGEAITRAYALADQLRFEGMHYRKDIGRRALTSR